VRLYSNLVRVGCQDTPAVARRRKWKSGVWAGGLVHPSPFPFSPKPAIIRSVAVRRGSHSETIKPMLSIWRRWRVSQCGAQGLRAEGRLALAAFAAMARRSEGMAVGVAHTAKRTWIYDTKVAGITPK